MRAALKICALALLALFLVEMGLRLFGLGLAHVQSVRNAGTGGADEVRIVTLGESTTADFMAPNGRSWPRMMAEVLRSEGIRAHVINEARPGTPTAALLGRLEHILSSSQPDIVIAMMGVNDAGALPLNEMGLISDGDSGAFANLRVVKLARLLSSLPASFADRVHRVPPSDLGSSDAKDLVEQIRAGDAEAARKTIDEFLAGRSDVERAQFYAYLADSLSPPWGTAFHEFATAHEYRRESVRASLLVEMEPDKFALFAKGLHKTDDCRWLARRYVDSGLEPTDMAVRWLSRCTVPELEEARILREKFFPYLAAPDEGRSADTGESYRLLYDRLARDGVCLIAMQYPLRPIQELMAYFTLRQTEAASADPRLVFVDNEEVFREALASQPYDALFSDRFAVNFGHTTELGHSIIGRNIARVTAALVRSGACRARAELASR